MKRVFWSIFFIWGCQSTPQSPIKSSTDTLAPTVSQPSPPKPVYNPYWTDLARLLAGLRPRDTVFWAAALRDTAWQSYARRLDYLWTIRKKALYDSLRVWAARELQPYHEWKGSVFYPFSGADWPTIFYVYPQGSRYVFFGLEQEGDPHVLRLLAPEEIARGLQGTYSTLEDLLRLSFFKTKDMQVKLAHGKVRGLLPVFLALFGRTGHLVYSVEHIVLREGGKVDTLSGGKSKPAQSAWDNPITGLRFVVGLPDGPTQEVIYLSLNAANAGLEKQIGSRDFLGTLRPCVTLIKSASYLLFGADFSEMRRLILTQSVAILEEDSGIPYKYFDSTAWRVQLFGVYHQPILLFRSKYQQDLWQAYRTYPVKRLPFTIGYHTVPGQSNLIWAVRRDPQAALPPLPEELEASQGKVSPLPPQTVLPTLKDTLLGRSDSAPRDTKAPVLPSPTEVPSGDSE
ncbi:MAG: hypothetical protein N3A68_04020 [Bacteroidia bacterium]|nr:hypothetical protein [Bacteroidia bacterium]GIV22581.1 MAG: hypothetical protein KatS3mg025_0240 [Bacteroidia bacterium]